MKKLCLLLIALITLAATPVRADYIYGDISFDPRITSFDVNGDGSLVRDPSGEFRITEVETGTSRYGFFEDVNFPKNIPWGDFSIGAYGQMDGAPITISNASFGTFVGTVLSDVLTRIDPADPNSRVVDRSLLFGGVWSPGTYALFDGFRDAVSSTIRMSLITNPGTASGTINADMLLAANAIVPEPSSTAVLGILAGVQVYRRRRINAKSAPSMGG
ncbi:MAG: hypothetical protein RL215_1960 [Planctomycetota bacterium]